MVTIYFLRHAETPYNAAQTHIGGKSLNLGLSEIGIQQSLEAANWFKNAAIEFTSVICSSAVRAKLTLNPIIEACNISSEKIIYTPDLTEVGQGKWEGHLRSEIFTAEITKRAIEEAPFFKAPEGESHKDAEIRMMALVKREILDKYPTGKFLLVGRGLSFKCFLEGIMGINPQMTYKIAIGNVSLSRLRYEDERGWFLDFLNRKIIG